VIVFFQGIFLALNYWNSRIKQFGRLSIAQIVSSLTAQSAKLVTGLTGFVSGGVLIGTAVLGSIVSATMLGGQVWRDDKKLFLKHVRWKAIGHGYVRFKKFPIIDTWGGLMNSISWQLPALVLSSLFSVANVGYYALGLAVINGPLGMVSGALSQVFYQKACDEKNMRGNLGQLVEKLMESIIFIGLLPTMVLAMVGEEVFSVIFGERWFEAGRYAQILSPWMFFWFVSSPLSTLFSVYERQGSALSVHLLILITRVISLYIGGLYHNVYLALGLFSATGVVSYGFVAAWNIRLSQASGTKICFVLLKYGLYSLPVCFCIFLIKFMLQLRPIPILMSAMALMAIYYLLLNSKIASPIAKINAQYEK
jgi:O-antigen/teichoic acid export membrane protein